jgi:hypothetical protein
LGRVGGGGKRTGGREMGEERDGRNNGEGGEERGGEGRDRIE